jgi:hypothetical protein
MSQTSYRCRQSWQIRHTFEPNRLGPIHLAEAYEQIVPIYVKLLPHRHRELNVRQKNSEMLQMDQRRAA